MTAAKVIEEIKRAKNNKQRVLSEALNANVWADHRYGRTVLGPIKNIATIPRITPANVPIAIVHPVSILNNCWGGSFD